MKTKKIIMVVCGILAVAAIAFAAWYLQDFDAQGYVKAVLDQNFKGKVSAAADFIEDKSKEELEQQYEDGVRSFAENNIISGTEMDEELKEKYVALCKKVFESMKYTVKEAEKINTKEYHVTVEYQAADVFQKFTEAVPEESARILEKVNKGEYKGTEEEINQQMKKEFLENCYTLLEKSFEEVQYGEKMTEVFVVKKNEERLFEIDDEQMKGFVKKIMGFTVNQD